MERTQGLRVLLAAIRWTARIVGIFVAGTVVALVIGHAFSEEGLPNPFTQPLPVTLEFAGLFAAVLGVILGWKWELLGGLLIIGGMVVFHVIEGKVWLGWVFELFALTGVLFVVHWYLKRFKAN